jgi:hypothetical protein
MSAYKNDVYPQGCVAEYAKTLSCPCCPQEFIDHILFDSKHKHPKKATVRAVPVKVKPFAMSFSATLQGESQDVSDHFPVLATFSV